jgi:hypothetical protein
VTYETSLRKLQPESLRLNGGRRLMRYAATDARLTPSLPPSTRSSFARSRNRTPRRSFHQALAQPQRLSHRRSTPLRVAATFVYSDGYRSGCKPIRRRWSASVERSASSKRAATSVWARARPPQRPNRLRNDLRGASLERPASGEEARWAAGALCARAG